MTTLKPQRDRSIVRARVATHIAFLLFGALFGTWVVSIPAVEDATGVSHAVLGSLLLLLGLGSIVAMQITGHLLARFSDRSGLLLGFIFFAVALSFPALTTGPVALGVALFILGLANGVVEVAVNNQAVEVERRFGVAIMSGFHAFYSLGGAIGAAIGGASQALNLPTWAPAATVGVCAVIGAPIMFRFLLTSRSEPEHAAGTVPTPVRRGRIWLLGVLAFLLMLCEGSANDWSALQAVEHLNVTDSAAAFAYGTFAVSMTVGRLTVDHVVRRFGPVAVVRYGAALAAVGMFIVITSPTLPITLSGWLLFGLGLSGVVPQIFTTAGNLPVARPATILSRIVGAGYTGSLAGPAVIGWLASIVGLSPALLVTVICCLVGVIFAGAVRTSRTSTT